MAFMFSTGLRLSQVFTESLSASLLGCVIRIYDGPVPASPDSKIDDTQNNLLLEIKEEGGTLTFEANNGDPTLVKNLAKTWTGDVAHTGFATFFRVEKEADNGAASTSVIRIQGSVGGPSSDLVISNASLIQGAPQRLEYFAISLLELS